MEESWSPRVRIPPSPLSYDHQHSENTTEVSNEKKFKSLEEKRQAEMEVAQEENAPQKASGKKTEVTGAAPLNNRLGERSFNLTFINITTTVWGHRVVWHPRGLQLRV